MWGGVELVFADHNVGGGGGGGVYSNKNDMEIS